VPGYELVGKTGTGEVADEEHGGYRDDVYNSSYIGYLPVGEQRVLAYLGLYGTEYLASYCACPAWAEMMEEALHKLGIPPTLPVTAKDYEFNEYSYYYKTFDFDAPEDDKKKDEKQGEGQDESQDGDGEGSQGGDQAQGGSDSSGGSDDGYDAYGTNDAYGAYGAYDDYMGEY
jgi:membrane carboxypeptidase/penicillin-binding protein